MASKPVKKKKPQDFTKNPVPGKGLKKKTKRVRATSVEYVAIGADVSTYSISLSGLALMKNGDTRHGSISKRWTKEHDYFSRMRDAARAHELVLDLMGGMNLLAELNDVFIAAEEPVSYGHLQRKESKTIKQQCQISGSFLGSMLRWGWNQIYEIQANSWRKVIADDLAAKHKVDFTIHKSKWNEPSFLAFPKEFHFSPKSAGKYRAAQWLHEIHPDWDGHWPDIISDNKLGMIPRPEGRKAQGVQPDDRYDAFPMAEWMRRELEKARKT